MCIIRDILYKSQETFLKKSSKNITGGILFLDVLYLWKSTLLFHFFFPVIQDWFILFRLLFYGLIILLAEYIYGFILKTIISKCPWHYSSKFSVNGLIRLDYLPIWMLVGWILEIVYINF